MTEHDIITHLSKIRKEMKAANDYRLTVHLNKNLSQIKTTDIEIIPNFYRFEIKGDFLIVYSRFEEHLYPLQHLQAFLSYADWLVYKENAVKNGINIRYNKSDLEYLKDCKLSFPIYGKFKLC